MAQVVPTHASPGGPAQARSKGVGFRRNRMRRSRPFRQCPRWVVAGGICVASGLSACGGASGVDLYQGKAGAAGSVATDASSGASGSSAGVGGADGSGGFPGPGGAGVGGSSGASGGSGTGGAGFGGSGG